MKYFAITMAALLFFGCKKESPDENEFHKMYGSESGDIGVFINEVEKQKVIFGHQSVGRNILSGIDYWEEQTGVNLNRESTRSISDTSKAFFLDFSVGSNGDPEGKIDDFVSLVEGLSDDLNCIVFFKLCYVDVLENTDVVGLFAHYKERMLYLKEQKPNIRIVLFTAPVTSVQTGIKATAKKALKRGSNDTQDNISRHNFNTMVKNELSVDFAIFDLAKVETTLPDGKSNTFSYKGVEYPCMPELYTNDGGHLNEYGSKIAAYNLLAFLATGLD
jgi:hypothetical protein